MNIDKYKIEIQDEYNLKLTVEVPKQKSPKGGIPKKGETTEKFVGYFGTLGGALQKITNMELFNSTDTMSLGEVINAIKTLETRLDLKYGSRQYVKEHIGEEF